MNALRRHDRMREEKPYFTVLVTSTEQNVVLVNGIRRAGQSVGLNLRIIACDRRPRASPAALLSDAAYLVPAQDDPQYIRALMDVCVVHRVDLVLPTTGREVALLNRNRDAFEKIGVALALGDASLPAEAPSKEPRNRRNSPTKSSSTAERRYSIALYFDRNGELQTIIPCEQTVVGGTVHLVTRRDPRISAAIRSAVVGSSSTQSIVVINAVLDDGGRVIIDDLSRGLVETIEIAHQAGAQLIDWLLQDHAGLVAEPNDDWQDGVEMLRYNAAMYLVPAPAPDC